MDLPSLAAIFEHDGPFATLYLNTDGAVENAAAKIELRWKDALRELAQAGVDDATRAALTEARGAAPHREGGTRVLVASGGRCHLAVSLPEPPATEVIRVGPLPYLLPLLDWAQTRIPHVVVLTDRVGADILGYTDDALPAESESLDEGRYPVHKARRTGWKELRAQHKVEDNWDASARDVAAEVERMAARIRADVVIAAGDPRAVTLLRRHLPAGLQRHLEVVEGSRAEDGSDAFVAEHVMEQLGLRASAQVIETLTDFGQSANAPDGVAATIEALRMAQVGTLLLTDQLAEDKPAFFGPEAALLALDEEELRSFGVPEPRHGALVDVLIRAALGTDAGVRLVPADTEDSPHEGAGALLRFSTAGSGIDAG